MLARIQTCLTLFPQGHHYYWTSFALNSERKKTPSLLVRNIPLTPSPLIFKKAVDHTCSCFVLRCGNHNEGNGTECAICLGAVALRFYGNTLPIVTVTLPSFLSLPTILRNSLSHKNGVERGQAWVSCDGTRHFYFVYFPPNVFILPLNPAIKSNNTILVKFFCSFIPTSCTDYSLRGI